MEYQEFLETIKQELLCSFSGIASITVERLPKNNGTTIDTMVVKKEGLNLAPSIHLTPYYARFLSGMSLEDIVSDIKLVYKNSEPRENLDLSDFYDYGKVRLNLEMRLVNFASNRELLETLPYVRFLDLAIVFRYAVPQCPKGKGTILIKSEHLKLWHVTTEELYRDARISSPLLAPPKFYRLSDLPSLQELPFPEEMLEELPLFILTTEPESDGAIAMVYDNVLKEISERFASGLLILPSSINEVLILPLPKPEKDSIYDSMIREVNELELTTAEILSDHTYYYDPQIGQLTM